VIKSIAAREIFKALSPGEAAIMGREFLRGGYFASRVGRRGSEGMIANYVKEQGNEYHRMDDDPDSALF
jgi:putative transposase